MDIFLKAMEFLSLKNIQNFFSIHLYECLALGFFFLILLHFSLKDPEKRKKPVSPSVPSPVPSPVLSPVPSPTLVYPRIAVSTQQKKELPFEAACILCNPYEPCSAGEKNFCQKIMAKSLAAPYFVGQYWVQINGHVYRPDFVIDPEGENPISIELDGFSYHGEAAVSKNQFNAELERQNNFLIAGWKVLRFSYDHMLKNPQGCIDLINITLEKIPFHFSPVKGISFSSEIPALKRKVYVEYKYVSKEFREILIQQFGAVYSIYRDVWHFPFGCTEKQIYDLWQIKEPHIWTPCVYCKGEAVQRTQRKTQKKFWSCQNPQCKKTFSFHN